MNIRSVTLGISMDTDFSSVELKTKLEKFLQEIKTEFAKKEISLRTFRINLTPVTEQSILDIDKQHEVLGKIESISKLCEALNIRWFNIPFDFTNSKNVEELENFAFEIIKRFPKTFISLIAVKNGVINYNAIQKAAKFIKNVSKLDNSGYNNFRVGVSCNAKPNTPFFPFTFSSNELGFSIALELPQELKKIIADKGNDLNSLRESSLEKLIPMIKETEYLSENIGSSNELKFHGIDVSLAPYPEEGGSVADLLESLGIEEQGSNGTLFLTSYLTDLLKTIIKRGNIKTTGFNGVMFSLLEDEVMCKRNDSRTYSLDSLIAYSAVCGCGLDMVPLPGDIFEEELSSIILDVAALSTTLDKPLGVRVLPIPMKHENEFTEFNMDFLFNTRVKKIKNLGFLNETLKKEEFYFLNKQDDNRLRKG